MKTYFIVFAVLLLVKPSLCLSLNNHDSLSADFCWKDSYDRGAGTIPTACGSFDQIGALCYPPCPAGYSRSGVDCHQNCLTGSGWADQGLYCRLVEYGRGVGYGWRGGDGFSNSGMFSRCEQDNGQGKCEQSGAIVYPKCKEGFQALGCCICRPAVPNCQALGYNNGVDLSCAKKIITGAPANMGCEGGLDYSAGLCYSLCREGYSGVGPRCWSKTPNGWVDCGMGAAKNGEVCSKQTKDEIKSIGGIALNIATFGSAIVIIKGSNIGANANVAQLKQKFNALKKLIDENKKAKQLLANGKGDIPIVPGGKTANQILKANSDSVTPEDIIRVSAQIASLADTTGISDVAATFSYPKCTALTI